MAISLGFPHPDVMLSSMTWTQFRELQMYVAMKENQREELRLQAEEARLRQFFSQVIAKQKGGQSA